MPQLMNQGRGGQIGEPCGTDGLGVCVGFAYGGAAGQWYVAHIDCDAAVKSRRDPLYNAVVQWVFRTIGGRMPYEADVALHVVTTGNDFSTFAILDGLRLWAAQQDVPVQPWSGFILDFDEIMPAPAGLQNNVQGPDEWTVPANPPIPAAPDA